jgi:hypothetical protein
MPSKMFTRTPFRVNDIHKRNDTLQAVALTAERTAPTVSLEGKIDDADDDYFYDDLRGQRTQVTLIDNYSGDLRS